MRILFQLIILIKNVFVTNIMTFSVKIGLLGDPAAGKTSLGRRYVDNTFTHEYKGTVGIDIYHKEYINNEKIINTAIWDMSGHKAFSRLRSQYLQGLNGVLIIFDSSRAFTIEGNIIPWIFELLQIQIKSNLPLAVIGNKNDIKAIQEVNDEKILTELKKIHNFEIIKYFSTSALSGDNVEEAFMWLIDQFIESVTDNKN